MINLKTTDDFLNFKRKNKRNIVKYIELCFNKDSNLNEIQNFGERQIKAAQKAKLDLTDNETMGILDFRDDEVNVLINTYIGKLQNSNLYDSLISNQFLFWSIQEEMRKPIQADGIKSRAELSKHSETVEKRIADLTFKIYGSEEKVVENGAKVIRMTYDQRIIDSNNVS